MITAVSSFNQSSAARQRNSSLKKNNSNVSFKEALPIIGGWGVFEPIGRNFEGYTDELLKKFGVRPVRDAILKRIPDEMIDPAVVALAKEKGQQVMVLFTRGWNIDWAILTDKDSRGIQKVQYKTTLPPVDLSDVKELNETNAKPLFDAVIPIL